MTKKVSKGGRMVPFKGVLEQREKDIFDLVLAELSKIEKSVLVGHSHFFEKDVQSLLKEPTNKRVFLYHLRKELDAAGYIYTVHTKRYELAYLEFTVPWWYRTDSIVHKFRQLVNYMSF